MKKHFSFLLDACMAMAFLTGCKDKNQPTPAPEPDMKAVAAGVQMIAKFDPQTIEQCDISFDYYDENGAIKNEVVTTSEWTKTIETKALPATLGFRWNLAVKADLDTTKYEHFLLSYSFEYFSVAINAAGAAVTPREGGTPDLTSGVAMRKRYFLVNTIMESNPVNFVHKYDAEGKLTTGKWE